MGAHQAISIHLASELFFPFPQIFQVEKVSSLRDDDSLPVKAFLDYMVRISREY